MSDLTLPGDIARVLRPCSPVVLTAHHMAGSHWSAVPGCRGVVHRLEDIAGVPGALCAWGAEDSEFEALVWAPLSGLALDLSDPTARAHAAWYCDRMVQDADRATARAIRSSDVSMRAHQSLAVADAIRGRPMDAERIRLLRELVLHVAGREESND